eukprot:2276469-Pyramimonas_sp.AAC.1
MVTRMTEGRTEARGFHMRRGRAIRMRRRRRRRRGRTIRAIGRIRRLGRVRMSGINSRPERKGPRQLQPWFAHAREP